MNDFGFLTRDEFTDNDTGYILVHRIECNLQERGREREEKEKRERERERERERGGNKITVLLYAPHPACLDCNKIIKYFSINTLAFNGLSLV